MPSSSPSGPVGPTRAGAAAGAAAPVSKVGARERRVSQVMVGLLAVVVAAGTATTGAGPHAGGVGAKRLPIALEDMTRIHSGLVICLVALTIALLYLLDDTGAPRSVLGRARVLLGAMIVQGGIGYGQYFSHLPALLVAVHVFGATWSGWRCSGSSTGSPTTAGSAQSRIPTSPPGSPLTA